MPRNTRNGIPKQIPTKIELKERELNTIERELKLKEKNQRDSA